RERPVVAAQNFFIALRCIARGLPPTKPRPAYRGPRAFGRADAIFSFCYPALAFSSQARLRTAPGYSLPSLAGLDFVRLLYPSFPLALFFSFLTMRENRAALRRGVVKMYYFSLDSRED